MCLGKRMLIADKRHFKLYIVEMTQVCINLIILIIHFYLVVFFYSVDDIPTVRITSEWRMSLRNLYPGASYQLKVFAISHGFLSEPHDYFQAVCKL